MEHCETKQKSIKNKKKKKTKYSTTIKIDAVTRNYHNTNKKQQNKTKQNNNDNNNNIYNNIYSRKREYNIEIKTSIIYIINKKQKDLFIKSLNNFFYNFCHFIIHWFKFEDSI